MKSEQILSAGHVAIVTGAASGIGKAVCRRLAGRGMSICLVDLPSQDLDETEAQIKEVSVDGASVVKIPTDIANPDQIRDPPRTGDGARWQSPFPDEQCRHQNRSWSRCRY